MSSSGRRPVGRSWRCTAGTPASNGSWSCSRGGHTTSRSSRPRSFSDAEITLSAIEEDGRRAEEIGRREIERLLHDQGVSDDDRVRIRVAVDDDRARGALKCFAGHDLIIAGVPDTGWLMAIESALDGATAAVLKRTPPLSRSGLPDWIPHINPSDYVELIQQLRQGSRWDANFVVMLGLASAIASLGLIQNSAAVVIGSMLLAPLMTPMIGVGMALVLANSGMIRLCLRSIVLGIVLTIAVGFMLGLLVPSGSTLSPEIEARGAPNLLDLLIALFAAIAASFALTRPGIVGAVAGVAIATALVPPACAVGISLAHGARLNAFGAFLLFLTNFTAIVFAAVGTFRAMGVSAARSMRRRRRAARLAITLLGVILMALSIPLGTALSEQFAEGRTEPLGHPVTRAAARAIDARVALEPGAKVMFMARSAVTGDVVIYVASEAALPRELAGELTAVVRQTMNDPALEVHVFAVQLAWGE